MLLDTSWLAPGYLVVDDRVPGKVGRVLRIINHLWVLVEWEHPAVRCAKFFQREERVDLLSLKE